MLLKCKSSSVVTSRGVTTVRTPTGMRMTMSTSSTMTPKIHRKGFRTPSKRYPGKGVPGKLHSISRISGKIPPGKKILSRPHPPSCDNSNDSGFGFEQHLEQNQQNHITRTIPTSRSICQHDENSTGAPDNITTRTNSSSSTSNLRNKRRKIETNTSIIPDNEDACSDENFLKIVTTASTINSIMPSTITTSSPTTKSYASGRNALRPGLKRTSSQLQTNAVATSKNGKIQLEIISQPEQQHRARYQTEGSRGAVKDRSGNGFPVVKLSGYTKPTTLEVFIGTDIGRVAPHMFYQACKVAGKNSTPCNEKKFEGTMVIEIEFKAETDMIITCDCVGILKERNVDVEHRFPDQSSQRNKKKSTRCRMVFKTQLTFDDGTTEILQVSSQPIICTQPPGVPEICKKSLTSCPASGGLELYIIGKNFLKDTVVIFRDENIGQMNTIWEQRVVPDKEYLQQTHLICVVPPYHQIITEPIEVELSIMSSGKISESHNFMYLPKDRHNILTSSTTISSIQSVSPDSQFPDNSANQSSLSLWTNSNPTNVPTPMIVETKHEVEQLMPPPITTNVPVRRSSIGLQVPNDATLLQQITNNTISAGNVAVPQINSPNSLKTEIIDENSQNSLIEEPPMQLDNNSSVSNLQQQFVTSNENAMNQLEDINSQQHQFRRIRKQSLHIIDIPNCMNDHSMHTFQTSPTSTNMVNNSADQIPQLDQVDAAAVAAVVVEMAVKQEQLGMQNQIIMANNFTTASLPQQQPQNTVVEKFFSNLETTSAQQTSVENYFTDSAPSQQQPTVEKFLTALDSNLNTIKSTSPLEMCPVQSAHNNILVDPSGTTTEFSFQPLSQEQFGANLLPTNNISQHIPIPPPPPPPMDHQMLTIGPDSPPTTLHLSPASNSSSSSSSGTFNSTNSPPVHHDIILNSQPAATINSINILIPNTSPPPQHSTTISSDLILNPSVSPSIMCPTPQTESLLVPHQVTLSTSLLNDMNNLQVEKSQQQQQEQTNNANLILKVAADFLINQENQERNVISSDQILQNIQHANVTTQQLPSSSPISQNQQICQSVVAAIQPQRQQQLIPYNGNILTNTLLQHANTNSLLPPTTTIVDISLNYPRGVENEFIQNIQQKSHQLSLTNSSTESLMQTQSLEKKNLLEVATTVRPQTTTHAIVTSSTTPQPIPQEITTMSDQDLISYINPSAFDQV